MITDDLSDATWLTHVQSDGSNIGGQPPLHYSVLPIPGKHHALLLSTAGNTGKATDYPAFLAYPSKPRPMLSTSGKLSFAFNYAVNGDLSGMNVGETDSLLVYAGWKYDASAQFHQQLGFQIVNARGDWVTVGFNPGPMVANVERKVVFDYFFDLNARLTSVLAITCDGVRFPVPVQFLKVPASDTSQGGKVTPWLGGAYPQFQLGSMPSGAPWAMAVSKTKYLWQ